LLLAINAEKSYTVVGLVKMSHLLREIAYIYKFIYKTPKKDKSIIFYAEVKEYCL